MSWFWNFKQIGNYILYPTFWAARDSKCFPVKFLIQVHAFKIDKNLNAQVWGEIKNLPEINLKLNFPNEIKIL